MRVSLLLASVTAFFCTGLASTCSMKHKPTPFEFGISLSDNITRENEVKLVTPQQHKIFQACQRDANRALPTDNQVSLFALVRPVITRWNSYHAAIERATKLYGAFDRYIEQHIKSVAFDERRSGSTSKDATITEYQNCLKPLKIATKRLEGRGEASSFGAIYEVLPVFEYLLRNLEELAQL
ncbi:hypothetical protein PtrSN002B_008818 [Pyrenophora tritici-repentis]|nr:hypothetical protein PtrSN002B_008818 [Pyrenophora tritici-repentis]